MKIQREAAKEEYRFECFIYAGRCFELHEVKPRLEAMLAPVIASIDFMRCKPNLHADTNYQKLILWCLDLP